MRVVSLLFKKKSFKISLLSKEVWWWRLSVICRGFVMQSPAWNMSVLPLSRSLLKLYKSCKFADPLLTISTSLVHVTCAPVTCTTVYMLLMSYCSSAFHCNAHLVLCSSSVSMRVGVCKPFQLVMRRQRWHLREPLSIEATFIWSLSAGYALTRNTLCAHPISPYLILSHPI